MAVRAGNKAEGQLVMCRMQDTKLKGKTVWRTWCCAWTLAQCSSSPLMVSYVL